MWILTAILCILLAISYLISHKRYKPFIETPEAAHYNFRFILPIGLLLLDIVNYHYGSRYDKKIHKQLRALNDGGSIELHQKLYYSCKLSTMWIVIAIMIFFGAASGTTDISYILFVLGSPAVIFYLHDNELAKTLRRKHESIQADFPDLVSKLVLLVNAGMNLSRAWEKICIENRRDTPLYQELRKTYLQIQSGRPESEAYEDFARRCKVKEISKFMSLLIQNIKKGSNDLVPLMKLQAENCWELRKARAKQLGEEASAKLLLPMMIMFVGILIIVILPAVLQLNNL